MMPEHSVRLRMPKRSCSLPANSVAKAVKKLVMEKVVATSASPQWNLSTSGWLNRLRVDGARAHLTDDGAENDCCDLPVWCSWPVSFLCVRCRA